MRFLGMYLYEERRKVKFPDNVESYRVNISNSIDSECRVEGTRDESWGLSTPGVNS